MESFQWGNPEWTTEEVILVGVEHLVRGEKEGILIVLGLEVEAVGEGCMAEAVELFICIIQMIVLELEVEAAQVMLEESIMVKPLRATKIFQLLLVGQKGGMLAMVMLE